MIRGNLCFVDDRKVLKQLALCKPHGAEFLEHAALGIVIFADGQKSDVWIEGLSYYKTKDDSV
jgi:hypothetical protein